MELSRSMTWRREDIIFRRYVIGPLMRQSCWSVTDREYDCKGISLQGDLYYIVCSYDDYECS
jgi:hypothetical protein